MGNKSGNSHGQKVATKRLRVMINTLRERWDKWWSGWIPEDDPGSRFIRLAPVYYPSRIFVDQVGQFCRRNWQTLLLAAIGLAGVMVAL